jgi:hypothetical protein
MTYSPTIGLDTQIEATREIVSSGKWLQWNEKPKLAVRSVVGYHGRGCDTLPRKYNAVAGPLSTGKEGREVFPNHGNLSKRTCCGVRHTEDLGRL